MLVAQQVVPAKGHSIRLPHSKYEMHEGDVLVLDEFIIECGHEGAVTLVGVSSNENKVCVENNTLYAKEPGSVIIDVKATLPDGFGSRFPITIIVRSTKIMMLPSSLTEIAEEAFMGTVAEEIILSDGCITIGSRAFADSNVKIMTVPASVTSIAEDAFAGCNLSIITSSGSTAEAFAKEHGIPCVIQ